jgi:hypothetical protein
MKFSGNIKKMISHHTDPINYEIPIGDEMISISSYLGKTIKIKFNGIINCVLCERVINKSFFQGHCYPCFINSPQTSECILRPELCRAHEGESRDMEWSKKHCLQEHVVYLSLTAGAKVGVTRGAQIPTRWIDQGAVQAIKFAETTNRFEAGVIELELKEHLSDRTAWQRMLKNDIDTSVDLLGLKEDLRQRVSDEYKHFILDDDSITAFHYPHLKYPTKIKSLDLQKINPIEGTLIAIKGQYLLFEENMAFNIRKHTGFDVQIAIKLF